MVESTNHRLFNLAIQVMQKSCETENVESGYLVKHDYYVPNEHVINYYATRLTSNVRCIDEDNSERLPCDARREYKESTKTEGYAS